MSEQAKIVFVDDDAMAGDLFGRYCRQEPFEVYAFRDPRDALAFIEQGDVALVVSDLNMPGMNGIELLQAVRKLDPGLPFLIITGFGTVDNAVAALRLGADDFIKKPYEMDQLVAMIRETLEKRTQTAAAPAPAPSRSAQPATGIIGESAAIREVYDIIERIRDVRVNVIIQGESGTGKELAARAIHNLSDFADKPFIVIDCGALTDTLLESELFGHEKGAFTGAAQTKPGLLEVASGGTVFLDEIGNISDNMQVKLLRVVQEQQVTRVGGVTPIDIDVRFVVATNRDLAAMVEAGQFRHDLYHRLNVVKIEMPPLRRRKEDIPALIRSFIREFAQRYRREAEDFDERSMQRLVDHAWPGNIRELKNLVERHVALATGPVMRLEDALEGVAEARRPEQAAGCIDTDQPSLAELEKRYILKTLERLDNNREQTARALGINKSTLWRKLQAYESET